MEAQAKKLEKLRVTAECQAEKAQLATENRATSEKLKNTLLHFFTLFCKKVKTV